MCSGRRFILGLALLAVWTGSVAAAQKPGVRPEQVPAADERARQMKAQAIAMRRTHGPEIIYTYAAIDDDLETITRHIATARAPLDDQFDLIAVLDRSRYSLDIAGGSVREDVTVLTVRGELAFDPHSRLWLEVSPYTGSSARAVGFGTGLLLDPRDDVRAELSAYGWQPWTENTLALSNDGRYHALTGALFVELTERLVAGLDAEQRWYYLGSEAPGGSRPAGRSSSIGLRADYALWQAPERVMGDGFRDRFGQGDETVVQGLRAYGSFRREYYSDQAPAVPTIDKSKDYRLGLNYDHVFTRHLAVSVGGFAGADWKRDLDPFDLNGYRARLIFVPNDRFRLWAGYRSISDVPTGLPGDRRSATELGINVNF